MSYSKYLRDNLVHSYSDDDADADEDISNVDKASGRHRNVHDPHQEIGDPDSDEEWDVGVDKFKHQTQEEFCEATNEDFKVNKGGYRDKYEDRGPRRNWQQWLEELGENADDEIEGDDDE